MLEKSEMFKKTKNLETDKIPPQTLYFQWVKKVKTIPYQGTWLCMCQCNDAFPEASATQT